MERLTEKHYLGTDHYIKCSETCAGDIDCIDCPAFDFLVERLAAYEDTCYTPEEIAKLQATLIVKNAELLKTREELEEHYDRMVGQLDALNDGLMASNAKLAADRKALINELCQYCGKYKHAHEGACDGCRWREDNG